MPGCTVPFCTNNTNKGFKVYHFPRDKERNCIWVNNCGKEHSWKPTNHTCICEAHFEDSQFESHRADGMRKLKPNAIPTIFKRKPVRCYTKKQKIENVDKDSLSLPPPSYVQFILDASTDIIPSNSESESIVTVLVTGESPEKGDTFHNTINVTNNSKAVEVFADHSYPKTLSTHSDIESDINLDVTVSSQDGIKEPNTENATQSTLSKDDSEILTANKPLRKHDKSLSTIKLKSVRQRARGSIKSRSSATSKLRKNCKISYNIKDSKCYLCEKLETKGAGTSLHSNTDTSKLYFHQKLSEIVASEKLSLTIEKDSVLCSQCTVLLNYADRIEIELRNIRASVVNHLRLKTGTHLPSTGISANTKDADSIVREPWAFAYSDASIQSKSKASASAHMAKRIQCHLCRFRTPHKSLMLFHLREHIRKSCWCDFCKKPLQEKDEQFCGLYTSNCNSNKVTLQRISSGDERNNDIEVVYDASEMQRRGSILRVALHRTDQVDLNSYDSNSQVLVIPYKSDLNTLHKCEERNSTTDSGNEEHSNLNADTHSQVLQMVNTNNLSPENSSNVSSRRSTDIDNVSVLNAHLIKTLNNLKVKPIGKTSGVESEMLSLESNSGEIKPLKQFRSLHDLGLLDVQEISDSGGNVFIL